jgi:hypothetical protein
MLLRTPTFSPRKSGSSVGSSSAAFSLLSPEVDCSGKTDRKDKPWLWFRSSTPRLITIFALVGVATLLFLLLQWAELAAWTAASSTSPGGRERGRRWSTEWGGGGRGTEVRGGKGHGDGGGLDVANGGIGSVGGASAGERVLDRTWSRQERRHTRRLPNTLSLRLPHTLSLRPIFNILHLESSGARLKTQSCTLNPKP